MDKKSLLELYHIATSESYSFLNVKLTATDKNEMYYQRLNQRGKIEEDLFDFDVTEPTQL